MRNITFTSTPLQGLLLFVCFFMLCALILIFFIYSYNSSVVRILGVRTDLQQVIIETETKEGLKASITLGLKDRCSWLFNNAGSKITVKVTNKTKGEVMLIKDTNKCSAYVVDTF